MGAILSAVILVRLSTLIEAQVLRGLLQANGIPASIPSEHHLGNDYLSMAAFNGAAIFVPESAMGDARAIISDVRAEVLLEDTEPPTFHQRYWRATALLAVLYALPIAIAVLAIWPELVFARVPGHYALNTGAPFPEPRHIYLRAELEASDIARTLREAGFSVFSDEERPNPWNPWTMAVALWVMVVGLLGLTGRKSSRAETLEESPT